MPKFKLTVYAYQTAEYEVQAASRAEAVQKVWLLRGCGTRVPGSTQHYGALDKHPLGELDDAHPGVLDELQDLVGDLELFIDTLTPVVAITEVSDA